MKNKLLNEYSKEKGLTHNENLSEQQLSVLITEQAIDTSPLLSEMGYVQAENMTYRNVYVNHPSVDDAVEGSPLPDSTVQTYSVTESDFNKISTNIELSNEVLTFSKFDIQENTKVLTSSATSSKIVELVLLDIKARELETPLTGEDIKKVKTGIASFSGMDNKSLYQSIGEAIKAIPDVYNPNSKVFLNKNNLVDFISRTTSEGDSINLFVGDLLMGIWPIVVVEQLSDNTIYFGDMESCFDLVSVAGNQTANPYSKPDSLRITNSSHYSNVAKDAKAIVALVAEV